MKKGIWKTGACAMIAGLFLLLPSEALAAAVPEGIRVEGQDLGGMDTEEAKQKIQEYVSDMAAQTITLEVADERVETTAEQLGFYWENTEVLEETIAEYTSGNVIQRYIKKKDLEHNPIELGLKLKIDSGAVENFVKTQCEPLMREALDARITRENGQFVVTPSQDGLSVDLEATVKSLNDALGAGLLEPVTVQAVVEESKPAKTTELLSTIQDVLGTFSTDFSSSGSSRATNLKVGAEKINGAVLMPGETLSGYEYMHPFTRENGYASAGAYENGQLVDSIGGGVCQIATTLYNAALLAEMEITQRQNHSMSVSYVSPSNDAAIAGTYKDIKITNPYDTPVYVEGGIFGRTLTFTIYGKETRPANRTIKYVSETLSVSDPGEPISQVDPSLQPGDRVRVQSGHRGIKSRLWKYVYVDGVETEKTILHTDTYNASKAIYRVGPPAPAVAPVETQAAMETGEPGQEEQNTEQPTSSGEIGPGITQPAVESQPENPDPVSQPQPEESVQGSEPEAAGQ